MVQKCASTTCAHTVPGGRFVFLMVVSWESASRSAGFNQKMVKIELITSIYSLTILSMLLSTAKSFVNGLKLASRSRLIAGKAFAYRLYASNEGGVSNEENTDLELDTPDTIPSSFNSKFLQFVTKLFQ